MNKYLVLLLVAATFQAGNTIKCFSCTSGDPDCGVLVTEETTNTTTCEYPEYCYTTFKGDGAIERGCMNFTECEVDPTCVSCIDNLCNAKAYKPLQCFGCTSETNAFCGYDFREDMVAKVWYCGDGASCYTSMAPDTGLVTRGCTSKPEYTCRRGLECEFCNTENCNGKGDGDVVNCFNCDPIRNDECADELVNEAKEFTVTCSNLFRKPLCYKWTRYGLPYRGCVAKNTTSMCREAGADTCHLCNTNECNNSSHLGPSFFVYLVAPIIASLWKYS